MANPLARTLITNISFEISDGGWRIRPGRFLRFIAAAVLLPAGAWAAPQLMQLVNEDTATHGDAGVYVLFVGNPAQVTAGGNPIQGARDLSLRIGTVSTLQSASATVVVATNYIGGATTMPQAPFPIKFLSGASVNKQVRVSAFDSGTGTFTVEQDPLAPAADWPLLAQAAGDQFTLGAYSQALSTLPAGVPFQSSLSGQMVTPRLVTAETLDAGVLYISYAPLVYVGSTAPPIVSADAQTFQTVEMTVGNQTNTDLTAIDAYAIPLQIAMVNSGTGAELEKRSFYVKQSTMQTELAALGLTKEGTSDIYLGPGQTVQKNAGNPSPFPSFKAYLTSLIGAPFIINNKSPFQAFGDPTPPVVYGITVQGGYKGTYRYSTSVTTEGANGFKITMTPTGNPADNELSTNPNPPPTYFPPLANLTNLTVNLANGSYDSVIYGAQLDSESFTINVSPTQRLSPVTVSGPFTVSSAASTSGFTVDGFKELDTANLGGGGLFVRFAAGPAADPTPVAITSVSTTGVVALAGTLPAAPNNGDSFEVLFRVAGQPSTSSYLAPELASLKFLPPFDVTFKSGAASGQVRDVVAFSPSGLVTMGPLSGGGEIAPADNDFYTVQVNDDDAITQLYTNSIFTFAIADVLAGLNLGYPGSPTAGAESRDWYYGFPQRYPFALTRPTPDDGFYNPWAAFLYSTSDAYSFAFSDRIVPPVLLKNEVGNANTFRVTLLPANQIDSPLVKATTKAMTGMPSLSQIDLTWTPEPGVTYDVTAEPAVDSGDITVDSAAGTATLSSLPPGVPYVIFVEGTKGAQASLVLPTYLTSFGEVTTITGDNTLQFNFSWAGEADISPTEFDLFVNGLPMPLQNTPPTQVSPLFSSGPLGKNLFVVDFQDPTTHASVYKGVIDIDFVTDADPNQFQVALNPAPTLYGSVNAVNPAGRGLTVAPAAPGPYTKINNVLSLGMAFNPEPRKQFAEVTVPTPTPTPTPTPPPAPAPTPAPEPAPSVKANGKNTIRTNAKTVRLRGPAVGQKVVIKYQKKPGKRVTRNVRIRANGQWLFKVRPQVKRTVFRFYAVNADGSRSKTQKVRVIQTNN